MPQSHTNRLNPILLWAGVLLFIVLSIWGLRNLLRDKLPVAARKVSYQDLIISNSTNGSVEPVDEFEDHALFAGTIDHVYVQQGDIVPKGKLLLTIRDDDAREHLATALSNLRGAQANLDKLQHGGTQDDRIRLNQQMTQAQMQVQMDTQALASVKGLMGAGAASQNEVTAAQQRLQAAQNNLTTLGQRKTNDYSSSELTQTQAQVTDAKTAYAVAQSVVNSAHVVAPFAGTVYSLAVSATNYVNPGQKLLDIADLTQLRVRAYFDEPELGPLKVGQPVTIEWDAHPDLHWNGHVERLASNIVAYGGNRNVGEVLIAVDDPPGPLLPNTTVKVKVTTLQLSHVLSVPRGALFTAGAENYVYKIVDDRLVRTDVQVGALSLVTVQITGGLQDNDVVAVGSNSGEPMADGAEVHIVK